MPTNRASDELRDGARLVARLIEPLTGQAYFAPECHERYEALGFSGSPFTTADGVALPDGPAYFTSRGSAMGQVPGELVAAAFGVFNPEVVVPAVAHGWTLTDAATIATARLDGAVGQLERVLGPAPEGIDRANELLGRAVAPLEPWGRALFAGNLALGLPGTPLGDLFRLGDQLREFRGDSHIAAWVAAGHDAAEIGLLTELYWGMPTRTYVRTRAWSDAQLDAAEARLTEAGLVKDAQLTEDGRAHREEIELATDAQMAPAIDALGGDLQELESLLKPWALSVMEKGGYPQSPLAITR
ncbi:MAG: SCO6745 family protein [Acidimicrobiales bacterium]